MKTLGQQRSEWVLKYMAQRYPLGMCETVRKPREACDLGVHMGTIRGLERRGLVYSPCPGVWILTETGRKEAANHE